MFRIDRQAKPGEVFINQFAIAPGVEGYETRKRAIETVLKRYGEGYCEIRFYWGKLELNGEAVSPEYFGRRMLGPNTANASGGAVFGRRKKSV